MSETEIQKRLKEAEKEMYGYKNHRKPCTKNDNIQDKVGITKFNKQEELTIEKPTKTGVVIDLMKDGPIKAIDYNKKEKSTEMEVRE